MLDFAGNAEAAKVGNRFVSVAKHSHWPRQAHPARRLQTNTSSASSAVGGGDATSTPAVLGPVITVTGADGAAVSSHNLRSVMQTESVALGYSSGGVVGHDTSHQLCARYMGTIGGDWPTVQVSMVLCAMMSFVVLKSHLPNTVLRINYSFTLYCTTNHCREDTGSRMPETSNRTETP